MIQSPIILQRYAHDPISHQIEMSFSFLLFFIFFLLTGGAELFLNFTTEMAVSDRLILGFHRLLGNTISQILSYDLVSKTAKTNSPSLFNSAKKANVFCYGYK